MISVEIRVAGTLGRLVRAHLAGFVAATERPVTMITGRLAPGENLATVLAIMVRHGVQVLDSRVYATAPSEPAPLPRAAGEPMVSRP
jgi:hypothetical protein